MTQTTDEIGDFIEANRCRTEIIGHIIEQFVSRAGDPRLWGPRPNMHLLRGIVAHTGMDLESHEVEDVVGYIWTTYIAPLRDELCGLWQRRDGTCQHCGTELKYHFNFMSSGANRYEEVCPVCQPHAAKRLRGT